MKKLNSIIVLLAVGFLFACNSNKPQTLSEENKTALMLLGDSISTEMQNVLLLNVATAIQQGGTDYAVEFCNVNALSITDSVALKHKTFIQRLSDKNRNPANAVNSQMDSLAWKKIKTDKTDFVTQDEQGDVYYYKPIMLGMPACIKCHGGKEDISESTQKLIAEKYPNDKALDYKLGDLRGMWKIKLKENE
ncbi:MAG TPA: DUF3365 domain-containing protein [Crocinitomicaceae bacterium]|nr:DUF3365 domain-containing protein [Crocinitomicaceae bacterium]